VHPFRPIGGFGDFSSTPSERGYPFFPISRLLKVDVLLLVHFSLESKLCGKYFVVLPRREAMNLNDMKVKGHPLTLVKLCTRRRILKQAKSFSDAESV
jgi:hypothetical protein